MLIIKIITNLKSCRNLLVFFSLVFLHNTVHSNENDHSSNVKIEDYCVTALEFYLDRPDLETEFLRRLQFCKETIKDVSPKGYIVNPILSDFRSMYGVNGRTRMQVHQGIDIIGGANEKIIAISDGIVLEIEEKLCEGPTLVIDHGESFNGEKLIGVYTHIGDSLVKEGDQVKRGMPVAELPEKISFPCMARVRHLHLQIGTQYCEKEEKNTWGCDFFIKDKYNSLNPHLYWADGENKVTCYEKNKKYKAGSITYPFSCTKKSAVNNN